MNIQGLNKAEVLAALFNASKPQGMGFLQYDPKPMTTEEAEAILKQTTNFDYLQGRVMKINLEKDEVGTWGYNRDNGENAAERVVEILRKSKDVNAEPIKEMHEINTLESAVNVENNLDTDETTVEGNTLHLGYSDVKEHLRPVVAKITKTPIKN